MSGRFNESRYVSAKKSVSCALIICETSACMIHGRIMLIYTPGIIYACVRFYFLLVFVFVFVFFFFLRLHIPNVVRPRSYRSAQRWSPANDKLSHTLRATVLQYVLFVRLTTNPYRTSADLSGGKPFGFYDKNDKCFLVNRNGK